jgi:hypothetical protein
VRRLRYFCADLAYWFGEALACFVVLCVLAGPFWLIWSVNLHFNGPYYTRYDDTGKIVLESRIIAGVPLPGTSPQTMFNVTDEAAAQEACRRRPPPFFLLFAKVYFSSFEDRPCYHTTAR